MNKENELEKIGFEVELPSPKDIVLVPEEKIRITKFTINRMVDLPKEKIVRVFLDELNSPIVLWENESYNEIGNWTNEDVSNKLKELFQ